MPGCETPDGCPIGEIGADPEANRAARRWLTWMAAHEMNKDPETYRRMCEEFQLYDDPAVLFKLEDIWRRYKCKDSNE